MKRLVFLLAFVLAACGGGGGGSGAGFPLPSAAAAPPKAAGPTYACSVVIYGDSIQALQGAKGVIEAKRPKWRVEDHAVAGTTLMMLSQTFFAEARSARYVVIENGAIDSWMGVPIGTVLDHYSRIVDHVRGEERTPIVTGFSHQRPPLAPDAIARRDHYNGALKTLMASKNVAFADYGTVPYDPLELFDDVHPGPAYAGRLTERLIETLDKAAPECSP
jgi:hypothetical protein